MVKRWMLGAAGLVWVAALAAGISVLFVYDNTPEGVAHAAPASWPADSRLHRRPGRATAIPGATDRRRSN